MSLDYAALAQDADAILKDLGMKVVLYRAGLKVGTGYGIFEGGDAKDETQSTSSLLAQTSLDHNSLILTGLLKQPMVGDVILFGKKQFTVTEVNTTAPTGIALIYKCRVTT